MLSFLPLLVWASCLPSSIATVAAPAEDPTSTETSELAEAQRLFNEGLSRYETADYEGAIEVFTLALSEVRERGVEDFNVLGPLLYNIGRARVRAYEIDRDIQNLRQAKVIFSRFVAEAELAPGEADPEDLADAQAQLQALELKLEALENQSEGPAEASDAQAGDAEPSKSTPRSHEINARRARRLGIGLSVGGLAFVGAGVGMLVWGAGYGPAAQSQVAQLDALGLPPEHPAVVDGERFIADERGKGTIWLATGGVTATLGVVGLAVGIVQLVKAKRLSSTQMSALPWLGPQGAGLSVSGRF